MVIDLNEFNKLDRIHPYPAKYTLDFALDIISKYSNEGDVIYDPFLGSGTTSLAAKITRRNSIGTDINPIAILISKFKTQSIQSENFKILERFITNIEKDIRVDEYEIINYEGIDHWFKQEVKIALSEILYNIERAFSGNEECLIFCKEVFSNILNQVSNQESDTRYAAVNKPEMTYEKVFEIYIKRFRFTLNLLEKCKLNNYQEHYSKILLQDSKKTSETFGEKIVDLIVTSPPYPNTYDYYLYHKHRMLWLGYDFKIAMNSEIGSRREFSSLKKPIENFEKDLYEIFSDANKILKNGAKIIIVIGDGRVRGKYYDSSLKTIKVCEEIGWKIVDTQSTELDLTSKSFQKSFRTKGKKEHVLVFQKEK